MLTIWYSNMKFVRQDCFNLLVKLDFINIQDNVIEILQENVFEKNVAVKSLNIGGNKIKILPEKLLAKLDQLVTFIANRNLIEKLPANFFSTNTKLHFINLNNNRILYVGVDFSKLHELNQVFGFQNNCTDFFMGERAKMAELETMIRTKCSDII